RDFVRAEEDRLDRVDASRRRIDGDPSLAAQQRAALSLSAKRARRRPVNGIPPALCRFGNQRRVTALVSLRLGGAGQKGRISRTVRPGGAGAQQQGGSSGLRPQGEGGTAAAG